MFGRIRRQLTAWYTSVLVLSLIIVGVAFYSAVSYGLGAQLDRNLQLAAAGQELLWERGDPQGLGIPRASDGSDRESRSGDERDEGHSNLPDELYDWRNQATSFLAVTDASGTTVYRSFETPSTVLPNTELVQQAVSTGKGSFATVNAAHGDVRIYTLPVFRNGQIERIIQVAQPLAFTGSFLRRIYYTLLVVGCVGVILSMLGGFWLSGRALSPIKESMESQRRFVADASHELRTPLSVIRAAAESVARRAEQPSSPDRLRERMNTITSEVDRMSGMVGELLDLARFETPRQAVALSPVNLVEVAGAVLPGLRLLAENKGLDFRYKAPDCLEVMGQADLLKQLITVVVDNAIKYTPKGHVALEVAERRGEAVLTVEDSGPGIPPEDLPHVFERFYRADPARSRETPGTGLGLALAQRIVSLHDGRIRIENIPDGGARVTVVLRMA